MTLATLRRRLWRARHDLAGILEAPYREGVEVRLHAVDYDALVTDFERVLDEVTALAQVRPRLAGAPYVFGIPVYACEMVEPGVIEVISRVEC